MKFLCYNINFGKDFYVLTKITENTQTHFLLKQFYYYFIKIVYLRDNIFLKMHALLHIIREISDLEPSLVYPILESFFLVTYKCVLWFSFFGHIWTRNVKLIIIILKIFTSLFISLISCFIDLFWTQLFWTQHIPSTDSFNGYTIRIAILKVTWNLTKYKNLPDSVIFW